MTSVLNVDTIADKAGTGPVGLTKQSAAKFFANFEQDGTQAITKSFNASSIADAGTGLTTIAFVSSMGDASYIITTNSTHDSGSYVGSICVSHDVPPTASQVQLDFLKFSEALADAELCMATAHGDLA